MADQPRPPSLCDGHPGTWDSARYPTQPLQDNVSQSTSRRGFRPRRTWGHLSPGPCRMHASLSDHEVLDSAGAVREVVGNGGSGHRFRAEIWVREEDACVQGGGC